MAKQLYTAREAAQALGISLDTLRRWDREGRIRTRRDAANRRVVTEPARVVAIVTRDAVDELGLKPGSPATAIVKSTSVMVES
jgi:molybdopterin-binding protein